MKTIMWDWLKQIKTKILLGYIVVGIVAFISIFFVYIQIKRYYATDGGDTLLRARYTLISSTLSELYKSESLLQKSIIGDGDLTSYYALMRGIEQNLDSLKKITPDTLQQERIDSIAVLLQDKNRALKLWLQSLKKTNAEQLFRENIDKTLLQRSETTLPIPITREKEIVSDTMIVVKPQKNFFKRLAYAFSPKKNTPEKIITTTEKHIIDTLRSTYNEADTIVSIFNNVSENVNEQKQEWLKGVLSSHSSLASKNKILVDKMNYLLREIEREELSRAETRFLLREKMISHTGNVMAAIAIISILLITGFVIFIWRDISKSNRYRRRLEEAKEYAENLLDSREKLMLTITHDIKAPLSSVLGYIDLLEREDIPQVAKEYLTSMQSSSKHILRLVMDLVDYHRLSLGKIEMNCAPFSLPKLLNDMIAEFKPLCEKKSLELISEFSTVDGCYLGDVHRIRQVIENLMSNAIKFTQEGHVGLTVSVDENNTLHIEVYDTGIGISKEEHERIFKEFVRLRSAKGAEGVGLGLSITQKLIQLQGGTLRLKSSENKGARFVVTIPLQKGDEIAVEPDSETNEPAETFIARCVLIDDDALQLKMTAAMMSQLGLSVTCCNTPDEVFEILSQEPVDILFTDIQMPIMDGYELVAKVKEILAYPELYPCFVAVTAREDTFESNDSAGVFAACLQKPFSREELQNILTRLTHVAFDKKTDADICNKISIASYDFSEMLAFAEGDANAQIDILDSFINEMKNYISQLNNGIEINDKCEVARIAHKLLPLMRLVQAYAQEKLLLAIEENRLTYADYSISVEEIITAVSHVIESAIQVKDVISEQKSL